jgi:hypothetical protein
MLWARITEILLETDACLLVRTSGTTPGVRFDPYRRGRCGALRLGVDRREEDEVFVLRFRKNNNKRSGMLDQVLVGWSLGRVGWASAG